MRPRTSLMVNPSYSRSGFVAGVLLCPSGAWLGSRGETGIGSDTSGLPVPVGATGSFPSGTGSGVCIFGWFVVAGSGGGARLGVRCRKTPTAMMRIALTPPVIIQSLFFCRGGAPRYTEGGPTSSWPEPATLSSVGNSRAVVATRSRHAARVSSSVQRSSTAPFATTESEASGRNRSPGITE